MSAALDVAGAAALLEQGQVVAFPTETVYGLGARADHDGAVAQIFAVKGRPSDHPLIVHVLDEEGAAVFAREVPPVARRLMKAFWPGPVTVIVPRRVEAARACAGGQDSIGLRCPAHPVARELLRAALARGVPGVAAPSANRFGRVSPTQAAHVHAEFGDAVPVLDGGECEAGIESAIVDCTRGLPVLLRPGTVSRRELEAAAGMALRERDGAAPRASGTLASHYAPMSRVRLIAAVEWGAALGQAQAAFRSSSQPMSGPPHTPPRVLGLYSPQEPSGVWSTDMVWRRMPEQPAAVAHDLFAALRELDVQVQARGGGEIWVVEPPGEEPWEGVRDRLMRAAATGAGRVLDAGLDEREQG